MDSDVGDDAVDCELGVTALTELWDDAVDTELASLTVDADDGVTSLTPDAVVAELLGDTELGVDCVAVVDELLDDTELGVDCVAVVDELLDDTELGVDCVAVVDELGVDAVDSELGVDAVDSELTEDGVSAPLCVDTELGEDADFELDDESSPPTYPTRIRRGL